MKMALQSVSEIRITNRNSFLKQIIFFSQCCPKKDKKEMLYQDVPLEGVRYYPIQNESNSETTEQHTAARCGMHISCRGEVCLPHHSSPLCTCSFTHTFFLTDQKYQDLSGWRINVEQLWKCTNECKLSLASAVLPTNCSVDLKGNWWRQVGVHSSIFLS